VLASRDAGPIRSRVDESADLVWSWWEIDQRWFDASVQVCVLGFRRPSTGPGAPLAWTRVVTDRLGIPSLDPTALRTDGTIGGRCELNANFRDEYYALVPAVDDDADGPPLITSGLIDPLVCAWGDRRVKFNKRWFEAPRVDLSRLEGRFPAWAERKLVPKVLVANQTKMVEAVADVDGSWLPGVPVTSIVPLTEDRDAARRQVREIEAILCSPVAAALCWHAGGGTGLSSQAVRLSPAVLGSVPWPAGDLGAAVEAARSADVLGCARAVLAAYGCAADEAEVLLTWWTQGLPSRDAPDPAGAGADGAGD
jgi:hypothetical protein